MKHAWKTSMTRVNGEVGENSEANSIVCMFHLGSTDARREKRRLRKDGRSSIVYLSFLSFGFLDLLPESPPGFSIGLLQQIVHFLNQRIDQKKIFISRD